MSNPLFSEVGIDGKTTTPYKFGDWRRYAIHNEETISGFFGDYRWMSNFESCPVYFDGVLFPIVLFDDDMEIDFDNYNQLEVIRKS